MTPFARAVLGRLEFVPFPAASVPAALAVMFPKMKPCVAFLSLTWVFWKPNLARKEKNSEDL